MSDPETKAAQVEKMPEVAKKVEVKEKICLIIHDGWGISDKKEGNAIAQSTTTNMDTIAKDHSSRHLAAHGIAVGLSDGLMGNSEVGHLNIGAGRVVWQDIVKIDLAIKKRTFHSNETIVGAFEAAKSNGGRVHLIGLISDGGVHSHIKHLFALLETAVAVSVPNVFIHFLGDGRDTAPRSAAGYLRDLNEFVEKVSADSKTKIQLATVVGRYYAMDRDKRWDRVKIAIDGLVGGVGDAVDDAPAAVKKIEENYNAETPVTDEFLKPIVVGGSDGRVKDGDSVFFFNYRSDRMREISSVFGLPDKPMDVQVPKDLKITTMARYSADFPFAVAYPPQAMTNVLAEVLAKNGIKQAHIAETEKYAHVTFFFNGGLEASFPDEDRHLIASPKVATYDLQPEMSVRGVAEKVAEVVKESKHDFVMCNFAPPDMVGHTGNLESAIKAIAATDEAVGIVYKACQEAGFVLFITADHGNAEQMLSENGKQPHTAHTCNKVPFIMSGDNKKISLVQKDKEGEDEGALCDVAPTILDLMGVQQPEEMGGRSLLVRS